MTEKYIVRSAELDLIQIYYYDLFSYFYIEVDYKGEKYFHITNGCYDIFPEYSDNHHSLLHDYFSSLDGRVVIQLVEKKSTLWWPRKCEVQDPEKVLVIIFPETEFGPESEEDCDVWEEKQLPLTKKEPENYIPDNKDEPEINSLIVENLELKYKLQQSERGRKKLIKSIRQILEE